MEQRKRKTWELIKRFAPYYKRYLNVMAMDLFCASLTTICEMVLPLILRYITNQGIQNLAALTAKPYGASASCTLACGSSMG